jgi:hypothetical protein
MWEMVRWGLAAVLPPACVYLAWLAVVHEEPCGTPACNVMVVVGFFLVAVVVAVKSFSSAARFLSAVLDYVSNGKK